MVDEEEEEVEEVYDDDVGYTNMWYEYLNKVHDV